MRGDAALGHDRAAGGPLHASRRPAGVVGDERRAAEPRRRGEAFRRGRDPGARPAARAVTPAGGASASDWAAAETAITGTGADWASRRSYLSPTLSPLITGG